MKSQITRTGAIASLALGQLLMTIACSPGFNTSGGTTAAVVTTTTANTMSVGGGCDVPLTGSGTAPFTYSLVSGTGLVNSGYFYAPTTSETDMVLSTDATGVAQYITITVTAGASCSGTSTGTSTQVSSGSLVASHSPATVTTNASVTEIVSGGVPPYTYTLSNGAGQLSGNFYTASTSDLGNTVVITITDSSGLSVSDYFSVSQGLAAGAPGTAIYMLSVNSATQGTTTTPGQCQSSSSSGGTLVGTVAEIYGKSFNHYGGDITFCTSSGTTIDQSQIVSDIYVTPYGSHTNNPSCPSGYTQNTIIADCAGGYCSGYQVVCSEMMDPTDAAAKYISNFYITAEGAHTTGACNSGDTKVGTVADCLGGSCSGTQAFCIKR